MLMPKRTKFRRPHRVSYEGHAKGGDTLAFGEYGLVSLEGAWVSARQIEASRVAMTRYMKRAGQVWTKIFPHLAKTKKPMEVRMGSGKGAPEDWVAVVKEGLILFEIAGVPEDVAKEALRLASHKLCVKTKFIKKENGGSNV